MRLALASLLALLMSAPTTAQHPLAGMIPVGFSALDTVIPRSATTHSLTVDVIDSEGGIATVTIGDESDSAVLDTHWTSGGLPIHITLPCKNYLTFERCAQAFQRKVDKLLEVFPRDP